MTSINTNIGALVAQKNMADNSAKLESSMERISSGLRINSASDDAAGSAIASKMESQVRSLGVAVRNANDAISLTQTAEGALSEVENILQRIRELTVQAGNSTLNTSDRSQIQAEVNALSSEIDSISNRTNFNGVNLLDGSRAAVSMQIGINASDTMSIGLQKTDVAALGIGSSSVSSSNTITSARMTELGSVNITTTDIKINGKNFAASDFDMDATTVDGASANVSAAVAAGSRQAAALAVKINENTG
jgi:flagellin